MSRKSGEQRRVEILEAAMGRFSVTGFEGTSTRSIAAAAGVTEALIFHYFPTKLALFRAALLEYGAQSLHPPEPSLLPALPLPERLTRLLETFLDTLWRNRVAIRMLVRAELDDPAAGDDLTALASQIREQLCFSLKNCEAAGEIRAGRAEQTATILFHALRGFFLAVVRVPPNGWDDLRATFITDIVSVILPGLQP